MRNHADADNFLHLQRDGDDVVAAQVRRAYAGRNGIAVRAGHQVDDRALIRHLDALFMVEGREDFLGKIKRVLVALLVCQARQGFQILHADALASGERVVAPDEDVRPCGKQLGKDEVRFAQRLSDDRLVERAQVDHAHFAAQMAHIHDRVIRLALAENKFIRLAALRAHQLDERAGREGIMLGGDGEALAARGVRDVFILDQRGLLHDLTRVAQKLRALLREQNTPAVAQKDGDARFLLQLAHGGGKAGLGDKQCLCGLGDGSALGDLDDVFQLLKRHKKTFPGALPQTRQEPKVLGKHSSKRESRLTV